MTTDPRLTPEPSAPPPPRQFPPGSQLASWIVTSLVVGWLIAYNAIRIAGGSPHGTAAIALIPGIAIGAVILAVTIAIWRRTSGSRREEAIAVPAALDQPALDALRVAAITLGVLGVIAIVVGVIVGLDWLGTDAGHRSPQRLVVAAWDLIAGGWLLAEAPRMLNGHADATESAALASILLAVFAGVALSRNWSETAQVILILVATAGAATAQVAHWRALGARGRPWGAVVAPLICIAALVLPLAL